MDTHEETKLCFGDSSTSEVIYKSNGDQDWFLTEHVRVSYRTMILN